MGVDSVALIVATLDRLMGLDLLLHGMGSTLACLPLTTFGGEDPTLPSAHADCLMEELEKHGKTYEFRLPRKRGAGIGVLQEVS